MILITQIRNATQIIDYGGTRFLIDPIFAPKGAYPPFPCLLRPDVRNPMHDLPIPMRDLMNVDAVIVTHLHAGHFDEEAKRALPKDMVVYVQNEADCSELTTAGFRNVHVLGEGSMFGEVQLIRTSGRHAYDDETADALGEVCRVMLRHAPDKTVYYTGDTVWCTEVEEATSAYKPLIIGANAGANSAMDKQLILGREELLRIHEAAPDAQIVATHMEAVNHWTLSRAELRAFAEEHGFSGILSIPEDGETIRFSDR